MDGATNFSLITNFVLGTFYRIRFRAEIGKFIRIEFPTNAFLINIYIKIYISLFSLSLNESDDACLLLHGINKLCRINFLGEVNF